MSTALKPFCDRLKKIIADLKPQQNALSFLIMLGKNAPGKSALLRQSRMEEVAHFGEDYPKIYYNPRGIILEISEKWINQSDTLLQHTLKQINHCHKITGLVFCLDINALLEFDSSESDVEKKNHLQYLSRFINSSGNEIPTHLIITKMDTLAGFSEFYQGDHAADLIKASGFSINSSSDPQKKKEQFTENFHAFLESIGQQVINKMHPARSTIKRTLIREFPLQLNSLRLPLQTFLQAIPPRFKLHSLYFTSAEQGGISIDRVNKKIQHEYALMVRDTFPQATNYRAYFIEGALQAIQAHTSQAAQPVKLARKGLLVGITGLVTLALAGLGSHHLKNSQLLESVNKELAAYDHLLEKDSHSPAALLHLIKARDRLDQLSAMAPATFHELQSQVQKDSQQKLHHDFLPALADTLEAILSNPNQSTVVRYKALKIYLMLGQTEHFDAKAIRLWFEQYFQKEQHTKQLALLDQFLRQHPQSFPVKNQLVSDVRNYLNALPANYLYYTLAKENFVSGSQPISIEGFRLGTSVVPAFFTKKGFKTISESLPLISKQLQAENWVLARQDLSSLQTMLTQSYCNDYVAFWKNFLRNTQLNHYENVQQGRALTHLLQQSKAIQTLISLVQEETKPDLNNENSLFNKYIGNIFTDLNLMTHTSIRELALTISELEKFIGTLSVVYDGGKTAFNLTKNRFISQDLNDPISLLYNQSRQLPEPVASWAKQLADDTWGMLIRDTRIYINQQWRETTYRDYQTNIARRYPFDSSLEQEISLEDFNRFFSTHGELNSFIEVYLKPFLDTSSAQWKPKDRNGYALPISPTMISELIRANIISNMFFPEQGEKAKISFSLQKISLDPIINSLQLDIGGTTLKDNQKSESYTRFIWPQEQHAKLSLNAIDGNHYEIAEEGNWALFRLLEKVNVLVDEEDSTSLQILFEVNSNSGRYLLRTKNPINAFAPGVLNGFILSDVII